jgi:molybdopterin converting factor small subunit
MMGQHDELVAKLRSGFLYGTSFAKARPIIADAIEQLQAQLAEAYDMGAERELKLHAQLAELREHLRIEEDECERQCARAETLQAQLSEAREHLRIEDELIARLRLGGPNAGEVGPEAADVIEQLQAQLAEAQKERDEARHYAKQCATLANVHEARAEAAERLAEEARAECRELRVERHVAQNMQAAAVRSRDEIVEACRTLFDKEPQTFRSTDDIRQSDDMCRVLMQIKDFRALRTLMEAVEKKDLDNA